MSQTKVITLLVPGLDVDPLNPIPLDASFRSNFKGYIGRRFISKLQVFFQKEVEISLLITSVILLHFTTPKFSPEEMILVMYNLTQ